MMTQWTRALVILLIISLLVMAGETAYFAMRDPLAALPRAEATPATSERRQERRDGRLWVHQTLTTPDLGALGLVISFPDPLPEQPLPVVFVLGGLGRGEDNIRYVPEPGANAVVGYDWPIPARLPGGVRLLLEASDLYDRVMVIPGHLAAAVDWLAAQPWADRNRISLLGFSLGALVVPAAQRLVEARGGAVGWTVLAYGGTGLGGLLANHPFLRPRWVRPFYGGLAGLLLRPIEPAEHLPHLNGRFFVLSGRGDTFIPESASARLRALTPEPKTVAVLEGGHMGIGPGQARLLKEIVRLSRDWLIKAGAVEAN